MTKTALLLCSLLLLPGVQAQEVARVYDASQYILIDARLLRGSVGYATFGISDVDTLADRLGQGVDLRIEARLISGFMKKTEGFVIADAFLLDMTMGRLTSEPLYYYDSPEDRFSTAMKFGYSFLAGYSTEQFGVLGGKSFEWSTAFVGGSTLPGKELMTGTAPWMARLEFRPAFSQEFRIMVTGWDNFNSNKQNKGFRVDLPFLPKKRFFLTYQYDRMGGDVSYATFNNDQYAPGIFTQHMFGLRFGSIY